MRRATLWTITRPASFSDSFFFMNIIIFFACNETILWTWSKRWCEQEINLCTFISRWPWATSTPNTALMPFVSHLTHSLLLGHCIFIANSIVLNKNLEIWYCIQCHRRLFLLNRNISIIRSWLVFQQNKISTLQWKRWWKV